MPYIGFAGRSVSVAVGSGLGPEALLVGVALAVGNVVGIGSAAVAVAVAVDVPGVGAVDVSTGRISVVTIEVGVVVAGEDSLQAASATAAATMGARLVKAFSVPQNGQRASALRTWR